MKRIKVGVTAARAAQSLSSALWSNGIGQNIGYLIMLLQRLPIVDAAVVVSCPGPEVHPLAAAFGAPSMPLDQAVECLDLIIELGARALSSSQLDRLHAHGGRLVSYVAGNTMVMNFEELACGVPHGDSVFDREFDACWVTPQNWHMCRSYLEITRSPNVRIAPHIWDPHCIRASAFNSGRTPYFRAPEDGRWNLGCFDPNVNVVKTFHYPVLVADSAYRRDPSSIANLMLFSAEFAKQDQHALQFIGAMDLGRHQRISVETRHPFINVIGNPVHAVISHQWENSLNYLYWDTLYLGWPLIHNSPDIAPAGYYYPSFDPAAGGEILLEALQTHAENLPRQRQLAMSLLWQFSVDNPGVIAAYRDLIDEVMSR